MRWYTPSQGDKRVVTRFLFFPRHLRRANQTRQEWRWLESAEIYQEWDLIDKWESMRWATDDANT